MRTPFDAAIEFIARARYHNHRLEAHSDIVSDGILDDLRARCPVIRKDLDRGVVRVWKNVSSPGDRERKVDLFVGEPDPEGKPDVSKVRIAIENKSVITAHRNATNRFDDLKKVVAAVQGARPEALLIATVLIGTAERFLNIPDQVHRFYRDREDEFERDVLPRLSSGDESLLIDFSFAISENSRTAPRKTLELFRSLPLRGSAQTHLVAYDSVLLVPVFIDNVHPPALPRPNNLGVDVDAEYETMIQRTCSGYTARWHM
ncbi:MAG TPA: hypothetical protein PKC83_15220 [Gemmatimonadaceae bacterium]|nr:hypothetical protein [Gemmatimonadaceae bacterium]